jgi:isopenicillin-N N-acyltransferase-like protein
MLGARPGGTAAGRREAVVTHPFPVYRVDAASPFERGVQYGRQAREQIAATVRTYRQIFRDFVHVEWDEARRIGRSYAAAIERYDRDIAEEIRGVAEGSGLAHDEALALNARSEIALSARYLDGCTSFAAFGRATRGETTVLAQNWDWRPSLRDSMVVLLVEQPGKPSLTMLTEAGIVGKLGFNSRGLGVCLNAILTDRLEQDATPLHVVLRGILDSRTLGEAIGAVARSGIACAANFLVAQHGNGALDIEAVPGDMDVLLPERDILSHTNHLTSLRLAGVRCLGRTGWPDTYPRLARVRRQLEERHGEIDTDAAREILRDHGNEPSSICRHLDEQVQPEGRRIQTVFSLVMNLEEGTLELTDGPPCSAEFVNPVRAAAAALGAEA